MDLREIAARVRAGDALDPDEREAVAEILETLARPRRPGRPADDDLMMRQFAVSYIYGHLAQRGKTKVARAVIAEMFGISESTVKGYLREVERAGHDWIAWQLDREGRLKEAMGLVLRTRAGAENPRN